MRAVFFLLLFSAAGIVFPADLGVKDPEFKKTPALSYTGNSFQAFSFMASVDYASSWDFSNALPTAYIPRLRIKLEATCSYGKGLLHIGLFVTFPFFDISQSQLHYRSTYGTYTLALGFGFPLYETKLSSGIWVLTTSFHFLMPFFKGVSITADRQIVDFSGASSYFPGEVGVLWEFRLSGYVHSFMGVSFALGFEYMSPQFA